MDHPAILIVDDDYDVRGSIAALLEGEGYRVLEAEDGAAALRCLRSPESFCLILLDLFMPVMNGWAFRAEQLRDPTLSSIPVLVITADATASRQAANLGAVDWLVKPLHFDRLLNVVAEHC